MQMQQYINKLGITSKNIDNPKAIRNKNKSKSKTISKEGKDDILLSK